MDSSSLPEILRFREESPQVALPLATQGVLRYVWESRYGVMLIEVSGNDTFVNGQRIVRVEERTASSAERT
jgi:hypothetical protein